MKGFVELINEEPTKMMILGASCSVVSQPVAETSQHWNLVQMSYSSTSDTLSSRTQFPYFFRTNPAQSGLNSPRIAIMKEYGWQKVAVIHEASDVYTGAMNIFLADLAQNNITVLTRETFATGEKPTGQLQNIKNKDGRIIVASAFEEGYKYLFCEAYLLGMFGPRYVWIIDSWNSFDWWRNVTWLGCTDDDMYEVLQNYIGTVFLDIRTDTQKTVSGLTAAQYQELYDTVTNGEPWPAEEFAPFGYDAVWAIALAFHEVSQQLEAEASSVKIQDFNYDNTNHLREKFLEAFHGLDFEGITGSVSFDASGNRLAPLKIEQFINGLEETVGTYLQKNGLHWLNADGLTFTGGATPQDGPSREIVHDAVDLVTFILFTAMSVIGMVLTIIFLTFNIKFRSRRLIKLSCPNVNNVIACGCFMCYVDVIVAGLSENLVSKSTMNHVCLAQVWILPIAFSLAFGGLFAKTWRVHVIFSKKTKRTKIVDSHLFVIIGVVVVVDIIIVSAWTIYDPSRLVEVTLPDEIDTEADKIIERHIHTCNSPNSPTFLWIGIIFAWKGILLIFGAFLAWETRTVSMPQLNDSKYIAASIYNVAIPSIIIAPLVTFISSDMPGVSFTLTASCIIFGTTVTNCLIFIPKIKALRQQIGKVTSIDRPGGSFHNNQVSPQNDVTSTNMSEHLLLKERDKKIAELQNQLKGKDAEIERLKELVNLDRADCH